MHRNFNKIPTAEILVANSRYLGTSTLKARLLREGLLEPHCYTCGLTEWLGKPLTLVLDHINGVRNDNRLANLRLLCPNCHSQTPTFAGRNAKHPSRRKRYYCPSCGKEISRFGQRCNRCAKRLQPTKIHWPPLDSLLQMIRESSCLVIARQLGVSETAL